MADFLFAVEDGVGRMVINRPEQRNALNDAVLEGILDAVARANRDPAIRLLTLTGAGDVAFSSGGDLKGMQLNADFGPLAMHFARARYSQTLAALSGAMVPVVGMANGDVLAGGLGLFLACDLTVASGHARFGLPEINVGLFPMMVMAVLFRSVGRKKAMELLLLGDKLGAEEALACGMLNRVFPKEDFAAQAAAFGARLAAKPGMVTRLGKAAYSAIEGIDAQAIELLQLSLGNVMQTEDFKEGVASFLQKKAPEWKHR
ncbi:MAG: enoyl-CoA hydratase/isomerase family protein [Candidatus Schekmanbacteria bacterium]|nr:enoyl-CoA hydratase/isomerase family protein [Candidatus Schekmanbacteria bacterium]